MFLRFVTRIFKIRPENQPVPAIAGCSTWPTPDDPSKTPSHREAGESAEKDREREEDETETLDVNDPENSHNTNTSEPPSKKRRVFEHKFNNEWLTTYPWLQRKGDKNFCTCCGRTFKCSLFDIKRHLNTEFHKRNMLKLKNTPKITDVIIDEAIIKRHRLAKEAELKICGFLHEHNLPFLLAEHLPSFIRSICPDSDIAKNISCSRTKATYVTNNFLNTQQLETISNKLKINKFSIIIDETTDINTEKSLVIVTRFYDETIKKVTDSFFGLIKIENCSAENIFSTILNHFKKHEIPIENMVGIAADNAAVMKGHKSGVQARFKEILPHIFFLGCTCHSIHLCASAAANKLPRSVEDFIRDVYNYFSNSSKRIDELRECQVFCQLKPTKLLHPAQTRWLSLQAAVDRVIQNWDALILFFTNECFNQNLHACDNILSSLKNPLYKLYFYFLSYILDIVNSLNLEFQSTKIKIHLLLNRTSDLYKTILKTYIRPEYIIKNKSNLKNIDPQNPQNFLPMDTIYFGAKVETYLSENANVLNPDAIKNFKIKCLDFYIELAKQIKDRFDFGNPVLSFITCFDPKSAISGEVSSIIVNCKKFFPNLVLDDEQLNSEWRMLPDITELVDLAKSNSYDMEIFWIKVFDIKNALDEAMFPNLTFFVKGILALPHSSAAAERIFSQLFLLKSKIRNRLSIETCSNILHVKELLGNETCYSWSPDSSMVKKYRANK